MTGRSPSASAHPQLPGCLAQGQSPIWEGRPSTPGLTFVVLDQLLQRVEVVSWGDVEATAVQSADLVVLHCPAPQLVPVPHRERVRAWAGRGELASPTGAHSCCTILACTEPWPSRASSTHPALLPPPLQPQASPQTPKAASKGHIPLSLPWHSHTWQHHRVWQGHFQPGHGPPSPSLQHSRSPGLGKELLFQAKVDGGSPLGSCSPPLCCGHLSTPFVVSLSLIMKDPIMFPGPRSCRSASFRLMSLKNHLQQNQMNQMNQGMLEWGRAGGRT